MNKIPEFKPLSQAEQRVENNKWTSGKMLIFISGVASISAGLYTSVFDIGNSINILLWIGGGLLIGKARNAL